MKIYYTREGGERGVGGRSENRRASKLLGEREKKRARIKERIIEETSGRQQHELRMWGLMGFVLQPETEQAESRVLYFSIIHQRFSTFGNVHAGLRACISAGRDRTALCALRMFYSY